MKPETIALHAGYDGDPATNAATTPIYQTTSFTFNDTQHGADLFDLKVPGNIYSRIMNPTNAVLEQRLTELEGGVGALTVASGMAAIRYAIEAIAEVGASSIRDMGKVMGALKARYAGQMDFGKASGAVKAKLG